jgi:hypothetical protein
MRCVKCAHTAASESNVVLYWCISIAILERMSFQGPAREEKLRETCEFGKKRVQSKLTACPRSELITSRETSDEESGESGSNDESDSQQSDDSYEHVNAMTDYGLIQRPFVCNMCKKTGKVA